MYSICKLLTINLLMEKKESNQSKIIYFNCLPNFNDRITISDGISYNILIVTDKSF